MNIEVVKKKSTFVDALLMFLILIAPILRYYDLPMSNLSFETIIVVLIIAIGGYIAFVRKSDSPKELLQSKRWYLFFIAWLIVITLIYEFCTDINVNSDSANYNLHALIIALLGALCIYIVLTGRINTSACIRIYSAFVYVIIAIYLLQWILLLTGNSINFKLPFAFNNAWKYLDLKVFGMNGFPTSIFSEKSHICEYLVPYIALCLYGKNIITKNRMKKAVFFTLCVISTASGNGIVLIALMWLMYFSFLGDFKKKQYRFLIFMIGIVLLIFGYYILSSIPRFSEMFDILFTDSSASDFSGSKADYRIYRGLDIFSKMPTWSQFFGVGYKHMYLFSEKFNVVSIFDVGGKVYEYFSAVSMVLIYSGIIGTFACFMHMYKLFKSKSDTVKGMIVVMVALWSSTEMLFNSTHLMYITLIVAVLYCEKVQQPCIKEQKCE